MHVEKWWENNTRPPTNSLLFLQNQCVKVFCVIIADGCLLSRAGKNTRHRSPTVAEERQLQHQESHSLSSHRWRGHWWCRSQRHPDSTPGPAEQVGKRWIFPFSPKYSPHAWCRRWQSGFHKMFKVHRSVQVQSFTRNAGSGIKKMFKNYLCKYKYQVKYQETGHLAPCLPPGKFTGKTEATPGWVCCH